MRLASLVSDLLPSSIAVFRLDLDLDTEPTPMRASLTAEEDVRMQRFARRADRVRFAAARVALRSLLAERMGCDPLALVFAAGPQGKPFVQGRDAPRFNVAHSGAHALVAIADAAAGIEVGVDIEGCARDVEVDALGAMVFTPDEREAVREAADPLAAFYLRWTGKEAVLKAVGVGITEHLQSVSIAQGAGDAIVLATRMPAWRELRAIRLAAPAGYAAALAWYRSTPG
ncbi:4'-phosphopantetheinyl transferase family protein [Variovorax sp. UC122_21]|uniref:4'-phosphopantetheinyl transferase family protein n=1 Tax=Variovorax sp. UC122_21 TaxID=3374554 RepID=UPI003757C0A0